MSVIHFTAEDLQVAAKQLESNQSDYTNNCQVLLYVAAANAAAYALQYRESNEIRVPLPTNEDSLPAEAYEETNPWRVIGRLTYNCVTNGGRDLLDDDVREALYEIAAAKAAEGPDGDPERIRARVISKTEALSMESARGSAINRSRVNKLTEELKQLKAIAKAIGQPSVYELAYEAGSAKQFEEAAPGLFVAID